MAVTLSFGFVEPQNGDNGSIFFPALANDIVQLNNHTHNGADSAQLTSTSITPTSATISSASWVATSGGTYRQSVTTPPSITFDDYGLVFRIATGPSAGYEIHPSVEKITNTTYYVYINDNSIDLTVLYMV